MGIFCESGLFGFIFRSKEMVTGGTMTMRTMEMTEITAEVEIKAEMESMAKTETVVEVDTTVEGKA